MTQSFRRCLLVPCLVLVPQALVAQREEKALKCKPGEAVIAYGAVPLGKHGLHELQQGQSWRLGSNDATTLTTQLPILDGEHVIAPGVYVAQLHRAGETELALSLSGGGGRGAPGGGAPGRGAPGGRPAGGQPGSGTGTTGAPRPRGGSGRLSGTLSRIKKPAKKLSIEWADAKRKPADPPCVKSADMNIEYGEHRVSVPLRFVKATTHRVQGYQGFGFTYPAEWFRGQLAAGTPIPVLSLVPRDKKARAAQPGFNVMVGKDRVELVPMARPPAGRGAGRGGRGGGRPAPGGAAGADGAAPEAKSGSVGWTANQGKQDAIAIQAVKSTRQELEFEIHTGDQVGKVKVALPAPAKR
ncbi:MAG: hypothetical protein H6836_04740 [Planctomycetes bacterium]|nr:hypothetical protein [Planctomycetota bacterium]MCB9888861.1 hypothetical protein [Planctomycetota bacterium]